MRITKREEEGEEKKREAHPCSFASEPSRPQCLESFAMLSSCRLFGWRDFEMWRRRRSNMFIKKAGKSFVKFLDHGTSDEEKKHFL